MQKEKETRIERSIAGKFFFAIPNPKRSNNSIQSTENPVRGYKGDCRTKSNRV